MIHTLNTSRGPAEAELVLVGVGSVDDSTPLDTLHCEHLTHMVPTKTSSAWYQPRQVVPGSGTMQYMV